MEKADLYNIKDGDLGSKVANGLQENFEQIVDALNGDFEASQVKFSDGQTFQQKLDNGTLKGDKGDTGATGAAGKDGATGAKGDKGDTGATGAAGKDGKSITAITLVKGADGSITGGTATLSDQSIIQITITTKSE